MQADLPQLQFCYLPLSDFARQQFSWLRQRYTCSLCNPAVLHVLRPLTTRASTAWAAITAEGHGLLCQRKPVLVGLPCCSLRRSALNAWAGACLLKYIDLLDGYKAISPPVEALQDLHQSQTVETRSRLMSADPLHRLSCYQRLTHTCGLPVWLVHPSQRLRARSEMSSSCSPRCWLRCPAS